LVQLVVLFAAVEERESALVPARLAQGLILIAAGAVNETGS
jgi:hypothetical protein